MHRLQGSCDNFEELYAQRISPWGKLSDNLVRHSRPMQDLHEALSCMA